MPVVIDVDHASARGELTIPTGASGIVLFAHGSGSSRHSPRNKYVAGVLQRAGLATLLMDLLTSAEEREDERTAVLRFDIDLLAERVCLAVDWLGSEPATSRMKIGLFGASTGAAAALVAAARKRDRISAVVSRGGRADLAGAALPLVTAPVLLIVGGDDQAVLDLNLRAKAHMKCRAGLEVVPGATHLFEEPGTLERVADLARDWFTHYLGVHDREST
ncbi:MAG: dienelactone hydrolase family protein [Planctomycetes bacterium]|nr:dienelactone hydrolase family protein [Planctomycetota bacterium]